MDDSYLLCNRVCIQSKMLEENIQAAFDRGKSGLENGVKVSGYR